MVDKPSRPKAAYLEEENPETGEALPDTKQSANAAAKRSAEKALRPGPRDAASDSGYSSHTNITGVSGNSGQPVKVAPPRPSSPKTKPVPTTVRRSSTTTSRPRGESKASSPEKHDIRPSPQTRQSSSYRYPCTDPVCNDPSCSRPRGSPEKKPAQLPPRVLDTRYAQYMASQPGAYLPQASPVLPPTLHYPPGYTAPPLLSYATPGPRPRAGSRPQSYHAGITPPAYYGYSPAGAYPPTPISREHYAAYEQSLAQAYSRPGMLPPNPSYISTSPPKKSSAPVRPGIPHAMTTENYSPRTMLPASNAPKVGTYDLPTRSNKLDEENYSTRGLPERKSSYRISGAYESESESDYSDEPPRLAVWYHERERDRIAMPPPNVPTTSLRPPLKQNLTTSDVVPTRSGSRRDRSRSITKYYYDESPRSRYEEDERAGYFEDARPSHKRTSSVRQPSVETTSSGRTRQTFYSGQPVTRVVERSSGRRTEYLGREQRQRRQEVDAMAHIDSIRGYRIPEVTAETLRKKENRQSMPVSSGSRPILHHSTSGKTPSVVSSSSQRSHRSRHSVNLSTHDEEKSHISRAADGSLRIRMDAHDGTTIEFSGDMDGRTISLKPAEEGGAAELVIGGPRGEKRYGGSIRSSTAASGSGRTSRSRAESEASRGRRYESSTRHESSRNRRRSGVSEGFYEKPM